MSAYRTEVVCGMGDRGFSQLALALAIVHQICKSAFVRNLWRVRVYGPGAFVCEYKHAYVYVPNTSVC